MTASKDKDLETITFTVKKGSPLAENLHRFKNGLKRLNPESTYGMDKLTIDQMSLTQEEAMKKGHSHFFNGKICRNGHIAPRTKRGECNQCVRNSANRQVRKKKAERLKQQKKKL